MIQSLLWIIFLTATISSAAPTGNTQVLKKNAPRAQLTAKLDSSVTPKSVVMKFAVQSSRYKRMCAFKTTNRFCFQISLTSIYFLFFFVLFFFF